MYEQTKRKRKEKRDQYIYAEMKAQSEGLTRRGMGEEKQGQQRADIMACFLRMTAEIDNYRDEQARNVRRRERLSDRLLQMAADFDLAKETWRDEIGW